MTEIQKSIVDRIEVKFKAIDQNPDVHLEGLVYAKPMNYWDYIMPDALLAFSTKRFAIAGFTGFLFNISLYTAPVAP